MAVVELYEEDHIYLTVTLDGETYEMTLRDREVIETIRSYQSPEVAVPAILRVGCSALRAAGIGIDLQSVRREFDLAVDQVATRLSAVGSQFERLANEDGPVATTIQQTGTMILDELRSVLADETNPSNGNSIAAKLGTAVARVEELVDFTRSEVAQEIRKAQQCQGATIDQAIRLMRETDSVVTTQRLDSIDKRITELTASLAANQAVKEQVLSQPGPARGQRYESLVGQVVGGIAFGAGDRAEATGKYAGESVGEKGMAKGGDLVCTLGGHPISKDLRIVIEAGDREPKVMTSKVVDEELEKAMANRNAQAAIFITARSDNPIMSGQPLVILARNKWVIYLSPNEPLNTRDLTLAYTLLRASVIADAVENAASDLATVREEIEGIERSLKGLAMARASITTMGKHVRESLASVSDSEREIRLAVGRIMASIGVGVGDLAR